MKELQPKVVHARFAVGPDWDASREKKWRSWKENEVYQKTTRSALPKDVKPIQTRWVYTIKDDGSYKSRLTTRGDVETRRDRAAGIEAVPADSPTVSRKALRLFFALTAFFYWHLDSFDIPPAFLQQDKKFMNHDVKRYILFRRRSVLRRATDQILCGDVSKRRTE